LTTEYKLIFNVSARQATVRESCLAIFTWVFALLTILCSISRSHYCLTDWTKTNTSAVAQIWCTTFRITSFASIFTCAVRTWWCASSALRRGL